MHEIKNKERILKNLNKLTLKSKLTMKDVIEIDEKLKEDMWNNFK